MPPPRQCRQRVNGARVLRLGFVYGVREWSAIGMLYLQTWRKICAHELKLDILAFPNTLA